MRQPHSFPNPTFQPFESSKPLLRRALASLRVKTIATITLALIIVTFVGLFSLQRLILVGFLHLEEGAMRTNMQRIDQSIQFDLSQIANAVAAWSTWDDTYLYAEKPNQKYIDINTSDNWFEQYDVNVILFANSVGEILFSKSYDLAKHKAEPIPSMLLRELTPTSSIFHHEQLDSFNGGIILLPEGPLLVVTRPILNSAGQGPSHGNVLLGRYLTQEELAELNEVTQLPFTVSRLDAAAPTTDVQSIRDSLLGGGEPVIKPLSDTVIGGYGLLKDVNGAPALMTQLELPRDIYAQGRLQSQYVVLALAVGGILIAVVVLVLIEQLVLKRLIRLDEQVAKIGVGADLAARVAVLGNDELAHLGVSINTMLDAQSQAQTERIQLEQARIEDLQRTATEQQELVAQLQASLLERDALSRTVQELSAPVIPVLPQTIVVPLVGTFNVERADDLQNVVLDAVQRHHISCVIIDVTGMRMFDTATAQTIIRLAAALRLLGAEAVLVGISPEVAQTLVQLGVTLADQKVAADLQTAVLSIAARSVGARAVVTPRLGPALHRGRG